MTGAVDREALPRRRHSADGSSMNLACIISAHKNARQLARLIRALATATTTFFVHIDLGTPDPQYRQMRRALATLEGEADVHFLKRYRTPWGGFGLVRAAVAGLSAAVNLRERAFDYVVSLTGQDYPIRPNAEIHEELTRGGGRSFMVSWPLPFAKWRNGGLDRFQCRHWTALGRRFRLPVRAASGAMRAKAPIRRALNRMLPRARPFLEGFKPFGGGAFWWLARSHAEYALSYLRANPSYSRYFRHVSIPDEMFFQTLLLNSPVAAQIVNDDLRYVDWKVGGSHPRTLGREDLTRLIGSGRLVARKFDESADSVVLDMIDAFRERPNS